MHGPRCLQPVRVLPLPSVWALGDQVALAAPEGAAHCEHQHGAPLHLRLQPAGRRHGQDGRHARDRAKAHLWVAVCPIRAFAKYLFISASVALRLYNTVRYYDSVQCPLLVASPNF